MKILKIKDLTGPNVWANFPVLEVWVDLETFEQRPSDLLPGFNERLMAWLPTMIEHRCSEGVRGGFFERLRRGTWLGHILEHTTLELQSLAGHVVGFGRARETSTSGVYRVAIEYRNATVAKAAVDAAFRLLMAAVDNTPFDVLSEVNRLRDLADDVCLGPSTQAIVDAAERRGIPWRRLTEGNLIRFGQGCRQRKIQAAETDTTGAIAESIAQDKELTRRLLGEIGLPVPEGEPVTTLEQALSEADDIGGAVVIKPQDGNQGRGVATNLTTKEQITQAFHAAKQESDSILVEKFIPGDDYRLLVVGSKLVAAARREPAHVVGDGKQTIEQLVALVNSDPRRGAGHSSSLTRLKFDDISLAVLADQGMDRNSIPADGQKVLLRRNANLSTGGTANDITAEVHPEFAARAVEAAQVVGLEIAGIDIVARDHRLPLDASNGAIIEVNAAPGLRMHLNPSAGEPQPVGDAIMDLLFPGNQTGRIPTVAVTGVNGKTTVTRLIAHILRSDGRMVGMTCTDGIWLGDRRIDNGDCSGPRSAQAVLAHPHLQAAVLETARGGILRAGLGFDRCDVAVVTNIGEGDHLGLDGIDTLEKLALVKRTIVDVVLPTGTGILNAADPLVADMAPKCPGRVLMFAVEEDHPRLAAHRETGGSVIFVRDGRIVLISQGQETVIDDLKNIPITVGGSVRFQVENVLAAAAAGWSLGLPLAQIHLGLQTFLPDLKHSPGRFNVLRSRCWWSLTTATALRPPGCSDPGRGSSARKPPQCRVFDRRRPPELRY
ncbi:MAG: cyanophycin synthetase [Planctomycetaceae bacterium]